MDVLLLKKVIIASTKASRGWVSVAAVVEAAEILWKLRKLPLK